MNMLKKSLALAVLALGVGVAQASPLASGKIISGTTFGTDDAFQFFNDSTAGERIVSLTWNLTPINAFFDTTSDAPGFSPSPLTLGPSSPVGATFPSNASVNGTSVLTITFADFDPGEVFRFGVDTDFFTNIDGFGLTGDQFVGATATAVFSDGNARTGTYVLTSEPGFGSRVDISIPTSVPEPATLAIFGLGLAGLGFLRRRKA